MTTGKYSRRDTYQTITNAIVAQIEAGIDGDSWTKPWKAPAGGSHQSIRSGTAYRGVNVPVLMGSAAAKGYTSGAWGTFKAWKEKGANARQGERGTHVVFWKTWKRTGVDENGDEAVETGMFAKLYSVFNAEQIDGFDLDAHNAKINASLPNGAERIAHADAAINAYTSAEGIEVRHGGAEAYYSRPHDRIQVPPVEAFTSTDGFYGTVLHEAGHSTGHEKRLDRQFGKRFGDNAYAFEELVAELTASMLCGHLHIEDAEHTRPDHAKYLANWLQVLKSDKKAIFTAASQAQKAADLILSYSEAAGDDADAPMATAA